MFKTIVLVAAWLAVGIKAFPPGIYFAESDGSSYAYLKYWDPYSATNTQHQVTNNAYVLLDLLRVLVKAFFRR